MNILAEDFRSRAGNRDVVPAATGTTVRRFIAAQVISSALRCPAIDVATQRWPADRALIGMLTRAATAPAMTAVVGWAAEIAQKRVAALEALAPASAGARLLQQSLVLSFDGAGQISAPGFVAVAGNAGFVAEGDPIPVRQLAASAALLQPHKLAAIAVLTIEMIESSNAEELISDVLISSAGAALDVALFGSAAASASAPAGLRAGIAASTASASTDLWEAFFEDVATLGTAVAAVAGARPIIFIASPGRAASMSMRSLTDTDDAIVLPSAAVGNDLIAVVPQALVAALEPEPEVETSSAGTLHMDSAPSQIVNGGPAAPARSLFQTASVALKMRWPVTWALRDPRGVAWLTPTWK